MSGERRVDHLRPDRLQAVECPFLVTPDQARVDCRIGGKGRGKTAGQAEAYRSKLRRCRGPRSPSRWLRFHHHVEAQVVSREIVRAALARLALCCG